MYRALLDGAVAEREKAEFMGGNLSRLFGLSQ